MADNGAATQIEQVDIPSEFGFENEHPSLSLPFQAGLDGKCYQGIEISLTQARIKATGKDGPRPEDQRRRTDEVCIRKLFCDAARRGCRRKGNERR